MVARVLAARPGLTVIEREGVVVWASPGATVRPGDPWEASGDDDGADVVLDARVHRIWYRRASSTSDPLFRALFEVNAVIKLLIDPADGDVGSILGVGFPAYLGGPFSMMDTIGIGAVIAECERLSASYGTHYAAPQLLRDMAAKGQTFYGANRVTPPAAAR